MAKILEKKDNHWPCCIQVPETDPLYLHPQPISQVLANEWTAALPWLQIWLFQSSYKKNNLNKTINLYHSVNFELLNYQNYYSFTHKCLVRNIIINFNVYIFRIVWTSWKQHLVTTSSRSFWFKSPKWSLWSSRFKLSIVLFFTNQVYLYIFTLIAIFIIL